MCEKEGSEPSCLELPAWAQVSEERRRHIAGVTELLNRWAIGMRIEPQEHQAWLDAGRWHDALKDASDHDLRSLVDVASYQPAILHGPAAAACLVRDGERRPGVLAAVRFHTVGWARWDRTGRALYMADFLDPARRFTQRDRAFLAAQAPHDFDGVFRQVVRARIDWTLREGFALYPETVDLWNSVK